MEPLNDQEIVECPACQGRTTVQWGQEEHTCLLCRGTGKIELKASNTACSKTSSIR